MIETIESKLNWPLSRADIAEISYESTALIVVRFDDGIIVGATPEADRLFGYIPGTLSAGDMELEKLIPEQYRAAHAKHWERFKRNPERRSMGASNDLLEGLRADGTKFPVVICLGACVKKKTKLAVAEIFEPRQRRGK